MPAGQRLFIGEPGELENGAGRAVAIRGWIVRFRELRQTTIVLVQDCAGVVQCGRLRRTQGPSPEVRGCGGDTRRRGPERLTAQVLERANVREATLYPRDRYRLAP